MAQEKEPEKLKGELPVRDATEVDTRRAQGESAEAGAQPMHRRAELRCRDIMKTDLVVVEPSATIAQAARQMLERGVGFLPVCDDDGKILGALTDRDITVRATAQGKDPRECRVSDIMSREVIACRPDDPLALAEQMMSQFRKSRALVTNYDGKVLGVISLSDIAESGPEDDASSVLRHVAAREAHP